MLDRVMNAPSLPGHHVIFASSLQPNSAYQEYLTYLSSFFAVTLQYKLNKENVTSKPILHSANVDLCVDLFLIFL